MTSSLARTWLTAALLALLLAVFGWASPVDAAVCGSEAAATAGDPHGLAAVHDHDQASEDSGGDHGPPCAHGHCHHAPAAPASAALGVTVHPVATTSLAGFPGALEPPSSSLPLPDQPPRA